MTIQTLTCVSITCDNECDDHGWPDGVPHFADRDEGIRYAQGAGFTIVGGTVLCGDCSAVRDCERLGHKWDEPWRDHIGHNGVPYRVRNCGHCSTSEHDPPWDDLMVLSRTADILNGAEGQP